MRTSKQAYVAAILALLLAGGVASAQSKPSDSGTEPDKSPASLIDVTKETQARSEELVRLQESEVSKASAKLDELRQLVAEGLVAKVELEESELRLTTLRNQLENTRKEIAASDQRITLIQKEQELAKAQVVALKTAKPTASLTKPTLFRYNGAAGWSIGNLTNVQAFFYNEFGRALPTSAVGQSATHNRLGYDHRNAVDVALHPDSPQGKLLINYLQNQGIPFLAFRAAVPGVATGPHIHIGNPSHRI